MCADAPPAPPHLGVPLQATRVTCAARTARQDTKRSLGDHMGLNRGVQLGRVRTGRGGLGT